MGASVLDDQDIIDAIGEVQPSAPYSQEHEKFVAMMKDDHKRARKASGIWRKTAIDCYDYVYGRQAPKNQNVFYMVLNLIIHRFLTKAGILTAGKPSAQISARSTRGGLDLEAGAIMKDLVEYGAEKDYLDTLIQDAVQDQLICGLGVLEEAYDITKKRWTNRHGHVYGKIVITKEDPLCYAFDPDNRDERMWGDTGPEYYTKIVELSRARLKVLYPGKKDQIAEVEATSEKDDEDEEPEHSGGVYSPDQTGDREPKNSDKLQLVEYHYKRMTPTAVVQKIYRTPDGAPGHIEIAKLPDWEAEEGQTDEDYEFAKYGKPGAYVDSDNIPQNEDGEERGVDDKGEFTYQKLAVPDEEIWEAAYLGNILLYNMPSIYKHGRWKAIFFTGMLRRSGEGYDPIPYGAIDQLIVPQDVINTNVSLIQDNARRINNPLTVVQPEAIIASQRGRIPQILAGPAPMLILEKGHTPDQVVKQFPPGPIPSQLLEFVDWIRVLIDEIASIAQVQRGGMPYDTSGKALEHLLQASDTALVNLQRNIEYAVTYWGENRVHNTQQFMTLEDSLRISDDLKSYQVEWKYYTDPEAPEEGTKLSLYKYEDFEPGKEPPEPKQILTDWSIADYDVQVGIKSNKGRDPEAELERDLKMLELGVVDRQYLIEQNEGIKNKRELLQRMQKKDEAMQAIEQWQQMLQDDSPQGILAKASQIPEVTDVIVRSLTAGGVDFGAIVQMVEQAGKTKQAA
uniref:Portal protein n=1 Tax=viral metagenome TaxID=1070528 RepID=A0A6M3IJW3_9ZZZZ